MTEFAFRKNLPDPIHTDRLILRAPLHADVPAMARLANNENIYKVLSRLPHPYTQQDAVDFIDNLARTETEHAYAILTRDENFIGTIGLHLDPGEPAEIGYWLGEPYWGDGFASEAVLALVSAADAAGCAALEARAISSNHASLRVLEKAGFIKISESVDDCGHHSGVPVTRLTRSPGTFQAEGADYLERRNQT